MSKWYRALFRGLDLLPSVFYGGGSFVLSVIVVGEKRRLRLTDQTQDTPRQ